MAPTEETHNNNCSIRKGGARPTARENLVINLEVRQEGDRIEPSTTQIPLPVMKCCVDDPG